MGSLARLTFAAVVTACTGLLAGCTPAPPAPPGGLALVQTQPITVLAPGRENGAVAQETASLLHRFLVTVDPRGNLVPDAAAAVPTIANRGISPDGLTIVYRIKPGIRFSDGSPLEASDVAATLTALTAASAVLPSRLGLDDVARIERLGPLEVRVRLRHPFAPILLYLCGPGNATPILRADQAGVIGDPQPMLHALAGGGPYRVRALTQGERLELEANPWYSPRPSVPSLTIQTVASSQTAHLQLHSREAEGYVMADPALEPELADVPGLRLATTPIDGIGALIYNTATPLLRDAAIRRALTSAVDASGSVRRAFRGGVATRDAPEGIFLWAYDPRAFPKTAYDPGLAGRELGALGWRTGADGRRYRDGVPLGLTMIVRGDQPSSLNLAIEFAQQLRSVGVSVQLRSYAIQEWTSPTGPLYGGRFDVAIAQFIAGYDPDVTDQFACSRVPPRGYNKPRYCNPALDRVLARAAATYDRAQRIALYREVQMILARDVPLVPLYRLVSLDGLPSKLHGVAPTPVTPFYGVAGWHIAR